jgi:8-oxo-dGTP pyrophosphatase MutT (NUDIX family)
MRAEQKPQLLHTDKSISMASNLLFIDVWQDDLPRIAREGLLAPKGEMIRLMASVAILPEMQESRAILVVDGMLLETEDAGPSFYIDVDQVPSSAILNAEPYLQIKGVPAAGGVIVRHSGSEPDVLTIFRRGEWDLPKGKIDKNETPPFAALREVREETGVADLEIVADLGTSLHGYPHGGRYCIKTTYWYQMRTNDTEFVPQEEEDIEQVAWMPWSKARSTLGYANLRDLLARIERESLMEI